MTESVTCSGRVDLRKALAAIKRERPAVAYIFWTHNDRKNDDELPLIEVPDGTVLIIELFSGLPRLHMAAGRVVLRACSVWGNAITVHGGELHVVTDGNNRKVTVNVEPHEDRDPRVTTRAEDALPSSRLRVWDRRSDAETPPVVEMDDRGIPTAWKVAPVPVQGIRNWF